MKVMKVYPHQGIGEVRFNMSRGEVERAMGSAPKRYVRNAPAPEEDFFEESGINVLYDKDGRCNAIGFGRGFNIDVEYDGYRLFAHPAGEVREWALAKDPSLDPTDGFTSKVLGLGMWSDWIDDTDLDSVQLKDPALSFLIFRPGYYEEDRPPLILPPEFNLD